MSCLEPLLRARMAQGEADLRGAVQGLFTSAFVRDYLPQTWLIVTDKETLTVYADQDGKITLRLGNTMARDGAISIGHDLLADSLRTGKMPPPNRFMMTFYTTKGEAAFRQLAKYFGM